MLIGVAVKLAGNLLLIPIPEINVSGAAISTLLCYFVIFVLSILVYSRAAGVKIRILKSLMPAVISGLFCALTAWSVYPHIPLVNRYALPIAVCAGGAVYLIVSKLTGNGENRN